MKKFSLFVVLFMLTCFVGCDIDYDETIGCDPQAVEMASEGGSFEVNLKSYVKWTATTPANWMHIDPETGRGDTVVKVTVDPATMGRKNVITFDNGYATTTVTVHQSTPSTTNSLNSK